MSRRVLAAAAWALAAALLAGACTCADGSERAVPERTAAPGAGAASAPAPAIPPYPPPAPAEPPAAGTPVAPPPLPAPERELLRDYARYWELYAEALLALDGSRLPEVMTGPRLERAREEIARLRAAGHAVRVDVENSPIVGMLAGEEAVIVDRYRNQSYLVDAASGRPVSARGVANSVHATVSLLREEGSWKVRDSRREEDPR
ncbi:MAG: hypothetical protein OXC94_01070 [Chloroflexi bacterium]|nr:hypothetical protein [Chloroflexota bacterium]